MAGVYDTGSDSKERCHASRGAHWPSPLIHESGLRRSSPQQHQRSARRWRSGVSVRKTFANILPTAKVLALCDRDDRSPAEVAEFERSGDIVLGWRDIESYLLADDVIETVVLREGKDHLLADALQVKADAVAASVARGNASDDLKSAAGEIYTNLKRLLTLQRCGILRTHFFEIPWRRWSPHRW